MSPKSIKTTCPYCGVGCGLLVKQDVQGTLSVQGDKSHPANYSRLCSKGAALGETLDKDGRLLQAELRGEVSDLDGALDFTAKEFMRITEQYGPESIAFYVSGQLLTEDYYVANKLMKGYIGAANIDTNSRLCMSSTVAGYKRAFGSDTVPGCYEDLERAKLIVLIGSNTAWCHPVLYQRIVKAKKDNPDLYIVVIDPRRTVTCDIADLHLAIRPSTDAYLFNGLLVYLADHDEHNHLYTQTVTEGLEAALEAARASSPSIGETAHKCGLAEDEVADFFRLFARTERVVSVFSQGVNQSSSGTDKVNSIINCHLITGRIGRPGMGPFSVTGQPNAMGGREVGGLANQLAAHMEIHREEHRDLLQRFWQSPVMVTREGLKAVDMFRAIESGQIKAVWIMATNPVVSMPDADRVRNALKQCELVVVSDCMRNTDTTACADVLLPAQAWGERNGTVTNSERRISRQRPFLTAPGDSKPDWWLIAEVAKRMGFATHFSYQNSYEIFREYAHLTHYENNGSRDLDLGGLADFSETEYANMEPVQWPVLKGQRAGVARMFSEGKYYTASGKAQFVSIVPREAAHRVTDEYPFILNTGRVRDHWHTMTRTGKSARLSQHIEEPFLEIHVDDASRLKLHSGGLVKLSSELGTVILRIVATETQQPGSVFAPMHWNDQFSGQARIDTLVHPVVDPVSGQPESKFTPVRIEPYEPGWHGFILSRRKLEIKDARYWTMARGADCWRYEIAGDIPDTDWSGYAQNLLGSDDATDTGWIEYFDTSQCRYRAARIVDDRLESCLFIGPDPNLPRRDYLISLFAKGSLDNRERASLLSGRPAEPQKDTGAIVCACFGVGEITIRDNILKNGLISVEQIGDLLKAGTNCGSCIPELHQLLETLQKETGT